MYCFNKVVAYDLMEVSPKAELYKDVNQFCLANYNDKRILLIGGEDDVQSVSNMVYFYNVGEDEWLEESNLITARTAPSSICICSKVYVFGGQDNDGYAIETIECIDMLK